jgi:hypothetical protein
MSRLKSLSHCAAPGHQPVFPCHVQTRHRPTGLPQHIQETKQVTQTTNLPLITLQPYQHYPSIRSPWPCLTISPHSILRLSTTSIMCPGQRRCGPTWQRTDNGSLSIALLQSPSQEKSRSPTWRSRLRPLGQCSLLLKRYSMFISMG